MISIGTKEEDSIQHVAGESHGVVKNNIKAIVKHFNFSGMNIKTILSNHKMVLRECQF